MKIRIGVGAAGASSTPEALAELVTAIDDLGFDSLWLSEVLTGPVLDPMVGLAWAAASKPRVKLGTTMLLPGRNVLRLAKQLASLDVLCRGRLLVTWVPGLTYAPEREAIGVEPATRRDHRRGAAALRRLWAGETVSHEGTAASFREVKLAVTRAAAARGLAGRHGARRARALRALVRRLAAVALHAGRSRCGARGNR
jgi:alkanesulfonate monooxygenase SsuD/methylene tetrahydromethanopterin reductase-like flavin-dependent oxidoreductase (luciferase family)